MGWDSLTCCLAEGSLGILDISSHNLARLGKWIWKVLQPGSMPWRELILALYPRLRLLNSGDRLGFSPIWKGICSLLDIFRISLSFHAGEVSSFRFWLDPWFNGERLKDKFPILFSAVNNKDITIEEARVRAPSGMVTGWSILFRYLVPFALLRSLKVDFTPFTLCSRVDTVRWKWTQIVFLYKFIVSAFKFQKDIRLQNTVLMAT